MSQPIVCSLTPDALADRLGWIGALNRDFLRAYTLERTTLRLVYDAAASRDVHALVASERKCCGFLRLGIAVSGDGIELRIDAPESELDVEPLFFPFFSGAPELAKRAR
jgi:hypothetical protein